MSIVVQWSHILFRSIPSTLRTPLRAGWRKHTLFELTFRGQEHESQIAQCLTHPESLTESRGLCGLQSESQKISSLDARSSMELNRYTTTTALAVDTKCHENGNALVKESYY